MNHIDRFYSTIAREKVDRPACWLGLPDRKAYQGLFDYFGVNSMEGLKRELDDDVSPVELPYHSPTSNAIYAAFDFTKKQPGHWIPEEDRTLTAPGFFEDYDDPDRINDFDWPDPEKYISREECAKVVENTPKDHAVLGVIWSAHFQDTCAAFGMESALVTMMTEPDMYRAVDRKILDFYLKSNEIFYESTKGRLNAVLIGNDMGSQTSLMLSPQLIREFIIPGARELVEQAKSYGLKVIYHSCGSIYDVIPDLIGAGVDVVHPIQALAKNMQPQLLKDSFGNKVSFCGGVDAQNLLVNGTPEQIADKVRELKTIFPTGLIISPSHEAILPDCNPANIAALINTVKE